MEERKRKRKGRRSKRPNKAEFDMRYYTLNMDAEAIAKEYGVKASTVYGWAYQFRNEEEKI